MSTAGGLGVDDALDTLVHQFADPLAFLRELVQNSLDAGSPEIEVRVEHEPASDGGAGLVRVHVDDWGEGMTAEIIDKQLTRLFSSSKEGDLTKIGKFGIGFVSVFAIGPVAVVVDTSRGGESWRVLFHEDRSFERIALATPVDGTKVTLYLRKTAAEVDAFRARAREVLTHWCKHATAVIRFDGEPVNQPLELASRCQVRHEEEGTVVVVGLTLDLQPFCGFYNKGLTLLETREAMLPGVELKISSRYLEHTLTRDNVLRDENFDKAMAIVRSVASGPLSARLLELLEPHRGAPDTDEAAAELYRLLAAWIRRRDGDLSGCGDLGEHRPFCGLEREPYSLATVAAARREGRLYFDDQASPVVARLRQQGTMVVRCRAGTPVHEALAAMRGPPLLRASNCFCIALPAKSAAEDRRWQLLSASLAEVLRGAGAKVREVRCGHLDYPGSAVAERMAIAQGEWGELTAVADATVLGASLFSKGRWVVLNADHPGMSALLRLAAREPELAAYVAAKDLYLWRELSAEADAALAAAAWEARCRRATR